MNRIKYENYLGAAGYDAVARRKIKELEEKVGGGSGGETKVIFTITGFNESDEPIFTCNMGYDEAVEAVRNCAPVFVVLDNPYGENYPYFSMQIVNETVVNSNNLYIRWYSQDNPSAHFQYYKPEDS